MSASMSSSFIGPNTRRRPSRIPPLRQALRRRPQSLASASVIARSREWARPGMRSWMVLIVTLAATVAASQTCKKREGKLRHKGLQTKRRLRF